jgi:PBSX family phage terminase large subunit
MGLSEKQLQILAFSRTGYDALICDGAIRSGKTSLMTLAFVDWAMKNYSGQRFGLCGKTVESCCKNLVLPFRRLGWARRRYAMKWRGKDKELVVQAGDRTNVFEVFGGHDERSFELIQGRTLAGVLLDEVALMPRSFVEQATGRCSVDGSRLWFNCNPGPPQHWFYEEWIKKAAERNALHLHFTMADNPGLSDKIRARYEGMYTGVFYRRYILGEWCVAEGLVYDFGEENIVDTVPEGGEYYISVDYGTMNPFSAGLWSLAGARAVRVAEYYYSGRATMAQRTDEEYCDEVIRLAGDRPIRQVIVDPSAASFIAALRKRGFTVVKANNDVMDGIRRVSEFLRAGNIKIARGCRDAIAEFGLYRWDEKKTEDTVIKENDHAMDEIRYFANTILRHKVRRGRGEDDI